MKKILRQAGGKFTPTVFLFTDSQIKDESFIEDINNLLNTVELLVPISVFHISEPQIPFAW